MAVYTAIDQASLGAFLAAYDLGAPLALEGIAEGVENSNFRLVTERGRYILTLYEKRVDPNDLPFFLGLMDHLAAKGVPCPTPIHGRDGAGAARAVRPAGGDGQLSRRSIAAGGSQAAHCARARRGARRGCIWPARISRGSGRTRCRWRAGGACSRPAAAAPTSCSPGLEEEIERELDDARARTGPTDLPHGVIHADLFPDNVFFQGDALTGIIDFYFACVDIIAYDLAICLNAWCFEPDGAFNITKARQMLAAYRAERPFTDASSRPCRCSRAAPPCAFC